MASADRIARIYVIAGTNGAGKSSIAGATFRRRGADYFNPDEAARAIGTANPGLPQRELNGLAWQEGRRLLERAIAERLDYAFETTLGGTTITVLLDGALDAGLDVCIWFAGLASPELHIARVKARVDRGGHAIPEPFIRRRYDASRLNLIGLLPRLTALRVFDNSAEADPARGSAPAPRIVLHVERGRILGPADLSRTPEWARPIVAAAMKGDPDGGLPTGT